MARPPRPIADHVSINTMHLAKGLEFRAVAAMACDDEVVSLQERIETVSDDSDLPALPRRDPGTLPREHARAAAIRSRHPRLGGPPPRRADGLSAKQYKALRRRYRTILTQAKRELPEIPPRADGQRGRIAKSDAHNLRERLKTYETEVLRFAEDPDVSFTNNRAERDLRMSKVKQKVSGCFRTGTYAHAWCRISSYLQSAAAQGYNPLVAIQIALAGNAANLIDAEQQPESQITTQK